MISKASREGSTVLTLPEEKISINLLILRETHTLAEKIFCTLLQFDPFTHSRSPEQMRQYHARPK